MNNVSPVPTSLRYGLILGFASILITLVLYFTGFLTNPSIAMISGLLSLVVYVVIIVLAIRSHREAQGGYITLGKGLVIGLFSSFIASLLMVVFTYVLYGILDPDLMDAQLKMSEEIMENFGFMSEEQIETAMNDARSKSTPLRNSLNQLGGVCCGGIVSLFAALILKKDPLDDNTII